MKYAVLPASLRGCGVVLLIAALIVAILGSGKSHADTCANGIIPIETPRELAYGDRGDRCEGLYFQQISSTGLRIVGYHATPNRFSAAENHTIVRGQFDGVKHLVVVSTRARQYYRLDAEFTSTTFVYPLAISRHPELDIKPSELTARLCVDGCDTLSPVLIPASLTDIEEYGLGAPYVTLQSTEDLATLRVELVDADSGQILFEKELLGGAVWAAWRPADLPLAELIGEAKRIRFKAVARGQASGDIDAVSATLIVH